MTVDPEWTKKFFNQEDYRGSSELSVVGGI